MRHICSPVFVVLLFVCFALQGCGIKPPNVSPTPEMEKSPYPRTYPAPKEQET